MCNDSVCLTLGASNRDGACIKKYGEQQTLQIRKSLSNPDQRIGNYHSRQMRKHRKTDGMADARGHTGQIKCGVFNKMRDRQAVLLLDFFHPSTRHQGMARICCPIVTWFKIANCLATQPERARSYVQQMMLRQQSRL